MQLRFTILKNAFANVLRGGATAAVSLALPHFLVKALDRDRFAAWSLILQIAAYASFIDFGLQTAVARFLARYNELGDRQRRDSLIDTAVLFLTGAAGLAGILFGIIIWRLPNIFHGTPPQLLPELRWAVATVAAGTTFLLPMSAFSGVLIGLQKNEFVALAIGGSRLLGGAAVLIAARHTSSLIVLGSCIGVSTVLGGCAQLLGARRLLAGFTLRPWHFHPAMAADLGKFCGGLTAWSISMFLVTGLDLTIVGAIDFRAVGYYSVAASLVSVFAGANAAVCTAFLAPVAALQAAGKKQKIRELILRASRLNTLVNLVFVIATVLLGYTLLRIWVGPVYARASMPVTVILMSANAIRLAANPFAMMLIATGQQRLGIAQGVIEGVVNLIASVAGALLLGPVGVAWGTLVGAVSGLGWACLLTVRSAREIPLGRRAFASDALLRPLGCVSPMLCLAATYHYLQPPAYAVVGAIACAIMTGILAFRFGGFLPEQTSGVVSPCL